MILFTCTKLGYLGGQFLNNALHHSKMLPDKCVFTHLSDLTFIPNRFGKNKIARNVFCKSGK